MKKLFALLLALTLTFQLSAPAWADTTEPVQTEPTELSASQEVPEEAAETVEPTGTTTMPVESPETQEETRQTEETEAAETAEPTETAETTQTPARFLAEEALNVIASGSCGNRVSWSLSSEGTLTVSGEGAMDDYISWNTAPWYQNRNSIEHVVVKSGVTHLSNYAFYGCGNLATAALEAGLQTIGEYAFSGCTGLTGVTLSDGLRSIGSCAFSGCTGLTGVTIPAGVTSIGSYAFLNCSDLTGVTIPENCRIFLGAFSGCSSLTGVTIPEGMTSIDNETFSGCSSLTSVTIPEGVTRIGESAFSGCSGLTGVTIPEGVTSIDTSAFSGCSGLTGVTIPKSVTSIGSSAFSGCSSLTGVTIPEGVTSIESYAFECCTGLTGVTIPEGVTSIGSRAFSGCSGLTGVTIPESVTSIGSSAFSGCSGLKDVCYGGTEADWANIEIRSGNDPLTNAAVHYGQTHICELTYIEAKAAACTEPGNNAYYYCPICKRVYRDENRAEETTVQAETLPALGHSMEKTSAKAAACTEDGSNEYFTCATCHKVFKDAQGDRETTVAAETLPALGHTMVRVETKAPTCTAQGNRVYYRCTTCGHSFKDKDGLEATTPEAETLAPLGHTMIETPAVEPTHTSGGNNAYYTCSACHKVFKDADGKTETAVEAEQLPRLPGLAHGTSGSLTWFLSEEEVLTISGSGKMPDYSGNDLAPWYAFRGKLQKVVLEDGVQSVGSYAFFDCNMLTEVELPQSVTRLGKLCFDGCGQLKLLSLDKIPAELTQKVTDLNGLATLAEPIQALVGNRAAYHWSLETVRGEDQASDIAKLDGAKLEVIHSGKFYLVCEEDYTGLSAAIQVGAMTATEIRPLDAERLVSGESLTLTAWAMPFETALSATWTLTEEGQAYASISSDGTLTAKVVTQPVQITVKAEPVNGEAAAEKTLWILPKTTGLGILADGHLTGQTLTVDLTETGELTLTAQIQPQGAGTRVLWSSSSPDVAAIDSSGHVRLVKPGTTVIRAETRDGSGIAAELALTVRYLDSAENLTLTARLPETGLEPGMTAKLTLSGENPVDPENVEFYIPEAMASIASVDETGTLTAGTTPGTVTVTAALKDDPLMRKAQLAVKVIPMLNYALRILPRISEGLGYVTADGSTFCGDITNIVGKNRSFTLTTQGQDYLGSWAAVTNVTYVSSDSDVAEVDAAGTVYLKAEGECTITVRSTDALQAEARLNVSVMDRAPRLGAATVTLNSSSTQGAAVDLVASYGNTVDTVTVYDYSKSTKNYALSTAFTAEAEEDTLTLYSQGALKNGTYPVKLEVACRTGVYTFTMNVKVTNTLPKVTVKQDAKLNLFYKDSAAPLTVTAPVRITNMELTDTDDFALASTEQGWELVSVTQNQKPDTKAALNVYLEGYQVPVTVNLTVGTVSTAPAVKLSAASSTLNTALSRSLTTQIRLLDKAGQPLELENPMAESDNAEVSVDGSLVTITLNEAKSNTVVLYLQDSTWAKPVKLTHKITVSDKMPTLKPAGALTLNSLFAAHTAQTGLILSQSNLNLVSVDMVPAAKEGTAAWAESEKLSVTYDPVTGCIAAAIKDADNAPKAGTYSFACTGTLEDGTQIPGGSLKVTVSAAAPKVKLSAASVKLNRFLAGEERAAVQVAASDGYQVTDLEGMPADCLNFDAGTGVLTASLPDENEVGGSYTLYPVVRDMETGEEVTLASKLTFRIQTYYTEKLGVSLSAKGKLDTQKDGEILYTVTKLTNCLGTVENVTLEGQDAECFQAELGTVNGKPTVRLSLIPGETYATNKAYRLQFRFYACGQEILSPVQTVKVTQTALKVTAPKTVTYYQAQTAPVRVALTANVPLEEVALNGKTAKEFQAAVGDVTLNGNRVDLEITNPGALIAGKSYSLVLDAAPVNQAENVKPAAVKLTVKVMK